MLQEYESFYCQDPYKTHKSDNSDYVMNELFTELWGGLKAQQEEKPEETAELEAVITRQKQEKLREKRQQSQKHRRGD